MQNVYFFFVPQCDCSVDYNDLQFHILGYDVQCSSEYMRFQLIRYMQTYLKGVQFVRQKLLAAKGLVVEDFISYISQQNNKGEEPSLYLMVRMIQKYLCVIRKNLIWYTSYCKDQEITVADCLIVPVFLESGTVRDTKVIAAGKSCSVGNPKLLLCSGEVYSPQGHWCMT